MRTLEEAQRVADRRNRRRAKRYPLLAHGGQLETVTADDVIAEERRFVERMAASEQAALERGAAVRALVIADLPTAEVERLDGERAKIYPPASEYTYSFWWKQLKRHAPETAWQHCLNRERHASFAKWHTHCPACGQPLRD